MPKPPAAFSPLMTTKSSFHWATSPGSRSATILRPLRPTTSPTKKRRISSGSATIDRLAFRQHQVELCVAFRRRNGLDLLRRKGKPHGDDRLYRAQRRKREIVITRPIPDALPRAVESGKRHDDHIGEHLGRRPGGLANSPNARAERLARRPGAERQRA